MDLLLLSFQFTKISYYSKTEYTPSLKELQDSKEVMPSKLLDGTKMKKLQLLIGLLKTLGVNLGELAD